MLKIAQISDPHIGATADFELAGVRTLESFRTVLAAAVRESPHLIVVTGDIAAHPSPDAYELFFTSFDRLDVPMTWLPGNHDAFDALVRAPYYTPYRKRIKFRGWQLMLLDSSVPGQPGGHLGPADLELLHMSLAELELPTLVFLHHHPLPIGCDWLDQQVLDNAAELEALLNAYPHARGVFCGHVHQASETRRDGRLYASAPSTCFQFQPNSRDFAMSAEQPGYRLLEMNSRGEISTRVERVVQTRFHVDTRCVGY